MSFATEIDSPIRLLLQAEAQIIAARATISRVLEDLDSNSRHQPRSYESLDNSTLAAIARRMIVKRRLRDRLLDIPELFGEPAWDMMLELFAAYIDGRPLSPTSACVSSSVSVQTGLRYLKALEDKGLVECVPDLADPCVVRVRLTQTAVARMAQLITRYARAPSDSLD